MRLTGVPMRLTTWNRVLYACHSDHISVAHAVLSWTLGRQIRCIILAHKKSFPSQALSKSVSLQRDKNCDDYSTISIAILCVRPDR